MAKPVITQRGVAGPSRSTKGGGQTLPSYLENNSSGAPSFTPPNELPGDNRQEVGAPIGSAMPPKEPIGIPPAPVMPPMMIEPVRTAASPEIPGFSLPGPTAGNEPAPVLKNRKPVVQSNAGENKNEDTVEKAPPKQTLQPPSPLLPESYVPGLPPTKTDNKPTVTPFAGNEPSRLPDVPPVVPQQPTVPQQPPPKAAPPVTPPTPPVLPPRAPRPFGDLGKLIEEAYKNPSRYDSEQAKKTFDYLKGDLERDRDMNLSASDSEAASRGVFYGTPGTNARMDARERFSRGLGDLATNIAREQATTAAQDRSMAFDDAFKFLGEGREDDRLQMQIAQLAAGLGNQGGINMNSLLGDMPTPDFGGGVDWSALGQLFAGGKQTNPPTQPPNTTAPASVTQKCKLEGRC